MVGKRKNKQKQIRLTEGESRWLSQKSFDLDRSESWILRDALAKVYPEVFENKNVVDGKNEIKQSRKKIA